MQINYPCSYAQVGRCRSKYRSRSPWVKECEHRPLPRHGRYIHLWRRAVWTRHHKQYYYSFCEMLHCTALHCNAVLQHTLIKNIGRANYMLFGFISLCKTWNFPREQLCWVLQFKQLLLQILSGDVISPSAHRLASQVHNNPLDWKVECCTAIPLYCCTVILAVLPYLYNNDWCRLMTFFKKG